MISALEAAARAEARDFTSYVFQYPPLAVWPKRVDEEALRAAWRGVAAGPCRPGLYVHVPFCRTRCTFCRFLVIESRRPRDHEVFLDALAQEAALWSPLMRGRRWSTVYFGGGTPSLLSGAQLERLFDILRRRFTLEAGAQIAFEANPDFLTSAKLRLLARLGVTRLTLALQTLDDRVIRAVDRTQTSSRAARVFAWAREAAIPAINVDLMAGLPRQSVSSFQDSLRRVIAWRPDMIHVSPFLSVPLTRYSQSGGRQTRKDERRIERMQAEAARGLRAAGYRPVPYDASGLSPEARNRQLEDSVIWNQPVLGLGPGAVSCAPGRARHVNAPTLSAYARLARAGRLPVWRACALTPEDGWRNFAINHLWYGRLLESDFERTFGREVPAALSSALASLERAGLLARDAAARGWSVLKRKPLRREQLAIRAGLYGPEVLRALSARSFL